MCDPIILMDKFVKGEITNDELQEEFHKLKIRSCLTCKFGNTLDRRCICCIRYPILRNKDYWEKS